MNPFKLHYRTTVQKDLSSKFFYENSNQLPKLKKIDLNIGVKECSLKNILPNFLTLELITSNYPQLTQSRKNSLVFANKKNAPAGVKITLQKDAAYSFFQKLNLQILSNLKTQKTSFSIAHSHSLSFSIRELDSFQEVTLFYNLFKNLQSIDVNIQTNCLKEFELTFFLTSFKFPGSTMRK